MFTCKNQCFRVLRIFIAYLMPGDTAVRPVENQLKGIAYPSLYQLFGSHKNYYNYTFFPAQIKVKRAKYCLLAYIL